MKKAMIVLAVAAILAGCSTAQDLGNSAADSAVRATKIYGGAKITEGVGKAFGY